MAGDSTRSDPQDQSIAELLKQLSQQTATLVRQELDLAKAEATEKGKKAGLGAGLVGGGGIVGLLAAGALTAAIVLALDTAMAAWLAALIVAVVYGAIGGGLALMGKTRIQEATPPVPEQTVETVKEDVAWAKTRARSAGR